MEAVKMQSVVNSLLECGICLEIYQDPRILPCGHTFCLSCLRQQVDKCRDPLLHLTCSLCRTQWTVPENGLDNMQKNFIANDFISSLPSVSQCGEADGDNEHEKIEYFCLDCWEPLCDSCSGFHKKLKLTKNHTIKKITELSKDDVSQRRREMTSKCQMHKDQHVTLYCTDCNEAICHTCFVVSHKIHTVIDLLEADKNFIEQITTLLNTLEVNSEKYSTQVLELNEQLQTFANWNKTTENEVQKSVSELKQNIKLIYEKLIDNIDKYEKSSLDWILSKNLAAKAVLEASLGNIEKMQSDSRKNVSVGKKLLNSTSTALERFNFVKEVSCEIDKTKNINKSKDIDTLQSNTPTMLWKMDFIEWSEKLLELFANVCLSQAPLCSFDNNENTAIKAYDRQVFQLTHLESRYEKFNISVYNEKLLAGAHNDKKLCIYNAFDFNYESTIEIPYFLRNASWTPEGHVICVTARTKLDINGNTVLLLSQTGETLKEFNLKLDIWNISVCDNCLFLAASSSGLYISHDFGFTWQLNTTSFKGRKITKVIRVIVDRCEFFWTIEDNFKVLHLYSLHPFDNTLSENSVQSLPLYQSVKSLPLHHSLCDIATDNKTCVFLACSLDNSVHVFSLTGQYLAKILSSEDFTSLSFSLATEKKQSRLLVGQVYGKITSVLYRLADRLDLAQLIDLNSIGLANQRRKAKPTRLDLTEVTLFDRTLTKA